MTRSRRHFSSEQQDEVVRRHLADKVPVSNLADEFQVQPTLVHLWVKLVLDHAAAAFEAVFEAQPAVVASKKPRTSASPSSKPSSPRRMRSWPN